MVGGAGRWRGGAATAGACGGASRSRRGRGERRPVLCAALQQVEGRDGAGPALEKESPPTWLGFKQCNSLENPADTIVLASLGD